MITKEQLKEYFEKPSYDVTLQELFKEFNLGAEDLNKLDLFLEELVDEGVIQKVYCEKHKVYEYDPFDNEENEDEEDMEDSE